MIIRQHAFRALMIFLSVSWCMLFSGCSGESGPTLIFPYPMPTDLRISGLINLSDVAVSSVFNGITPSLIDLRPFNLTVEDDPLKKTVAADLEGKFVLEPVSIRDQIVVLVRHATHKGLVLEWMAADSKGLYGERRAEITIRTTAQSMIARCLRDRYGRRINPEALTAQHINPTVTAIADVLEKHPEKISALALDQVPEVKAAYTAMAASLHQGNSGVYPNNLVLLFYMGADNSLAAQLSTSLEEIAAAGLPSSTQILIQADFPIDGTRRMMLAGNKLVELGAVGKLDSTSGAVIADFVAWSRRTFPAQRYGLVISSHADGWRNAGSLRGSLISDDDAGKKGNAIEIAAWIKGANASFDGYYRPLELLVLDACSMGSIEMAYEFRDCANYTVLSQAFVPAAGMPLGKILDSIDSAGVSKLENKALGRLFCEEYRKKYIDATVKIPATISMINNAGFTAFMPKLHNYLAQIYAEKQLYAPVLANLRDSLQIESEDAPAQFVVQAFERAESRDLLDLVTRARNPLPSVTLQTDQLLSVFSGLIEVNYRSSWHFPDANGLSIAFPDQTTFIQEYVGLAPAHYFLLKFCQDTLWDELLTAINLP